MKNKPKIEVHPKGEGPIRIAEEIESLLAANDKIDVEVVKYKQLSVVETLMITIIGTIVSNVVSHILVRLCDAAKTEDIKINVIVINQETKKSFKLPEEEKACLAAATSEEDND